MDLQRQPGAGRGITSSEVAGLTAGKLSLENARISAALSGTAL